ncbi:MAG: hypothetical protein K0Q79_1301 [Flavipsychrobacter sp.]|jgi:hypothetical protein|nr:hypothetical protein [Flavipsychrobacter sp.]
MRVHTFENLKKKMGTAFATCPALAVAFAGSCFLMPLFFDV